MFSLYLTDAIVCFPSSRNHQRALESMQASLEAEAKGKADTMRIKKKLEQDINELEVALDASNRGKAEMEKTVKRYQQQIRVKLFVTVYLKIIHSASQTRLLQINNARIPLFYCV